MNTATTSTKKTRMKRIATPVTDALPVKPKGSKLDQLAVLLSDPVGTTLDAMTTTTGWQGHSVRGAMAGALKKRGLIITSTKADGIRTYRASTAA